MAVSLSTKSHAVQRAGMKRGALSVFPFSLRPFFSVPPSQANFNMTFQHSVDAFLASSTRDSATASLKGFLGHPPFSTPLPSLFLGLFVDCSMIFQLSKIVHKSSFFAPAPRRLGRAQRYRSPSLLFNLFSF